MKNYFMLGGGVLLVVIVFLSVKFFSEESQNKIKRMFDAGYGFKYGKVDVLAGQSKPVMTWLGVEKLTTAVESSGEDARPYRFGYGYYDEDHDGKINNIEKELGKKYFEIGPYTMYVFRDTGKKQLIEK